MKILTRIMVWDLPIRAFHWLFAICYSAATTIALFADQNDSLFPYHAIFGLVVGFMLLLRIVYGFIGTKYARFDNFLFKPRTLLDYLLNVLLGKPPKFVGHNPGSAYAIYAMFILISATVISGIILSEVKDSNSSLHELLVDFMLSILVLHVLGVLVHSFQHKENIIAVMIHGYRQTDSDVGIKTSRKLVFLVFIFLAGLWSYGLLKNYNASTKSINLPILGSELHIGVIENEYEGIR